MREAVVPRFLAGARWWLVAAAAIGFTAFAAGLAFAPAQAWVAFLVSSFFFLTVSLGGMVFLAMMSVSNAAWHTAFRRVPQSLAAYVPFGALAMLALLVGAPWLYHWAEPGAAADDPLLQAKAAYLNTGFFAGRTVAVLAIWVIFALLMRRRSHPGSAPDSGPAGRSVALPAIFLFIFPFSFSIVCIDWLMSLDPHWTSSIFGLYNIAGLLSASVAAISALVVILRRGGLLPHVTEDHLHDLGKLLFGFSTVWAYLWFSQYLLIWYTNLPEENTHYLARMSGNVSILFFLNFLLSWVFPFVLLLSRSGKRSEKTLLVASGLVLKGKWLDIHLLVAPAVFEAYRGITVLEVAVFLGFGAAFLLIVDRALEEAPVETVKDAHAVKRPHRQPIPVPARSIQPVRVREEE